MEAIYFLTSQMWKQTHSREGDFQCKIVSSIIWDTPCTQGEIPFKPFYIPLMKPFMFGPLTQLDILTEFEKGIGPGIGMQDGETGF